MYNGKKIIAIIPARSGSKGIKDKNIKNLCGKPLMAYTIEAAIKSNIFDEIHVSTDSKKYMEIARSYGADVPFLREPKLATDEIGTWAVIKDVLTRFKLIGRSFDIVVILQPTSPLRDEEDIKTAINEYFVKNALAVISVCKTEHSPLWMNTLPKDNSMYQFINTDLMLPRQKLKQFYRINGAIYIVDTDIILAEKDIYGEHSYAVIMDSKKSIDIDEDIDFLMAEVLMKKQRD